MKLEYKVKGSSDIYTSEVDCSSKPSINIVIDGITVFYVENVDIENVKISDFINNFAD